MKILSAFSQFIEDLKEENVLFKKVLGFTLALCVILSSCFCGMVMTASADKAVNHGLYINNVSGSDHATVTLSKATYDLSSDTYTVDFDFYTLQKDANSQIEMRLTGDAGEQQAPLYSRDFVLGDWAHYNSTISYAGTAIMAKFYVWPGFEGYLDNITVKNSNGDIVMELDFEGKTTTVNAVGNSATASADVRECPGAYDETANHGLYVNTTALSDYSTVTLDNVVYGQISGTYTFEFDYYTLQNTADSRLNGRVVGEGEMACGAYITNFKQNAWLHYSSTFSNSNTAMMAKLYIWQGFEGYIDNIVIKKPDGTIAMNLDFEQKATKVSGTERGMNASVNECPKPFDVSKNHAVFVDSTACGDHSYITFDGVVKYGLTQGATYTVRMKYYTVSATPAAQFNMRVAGAGDAACSLYKVPASQDGGVTGQWLTYESTIVMPSTAHYFRLFVWPGFVGYFDDMELIDGSGNVVYSIDGESEGLKMTNGGPAAANLVAVQKEAPSIFDGVNNNYGLYINTVGKSDYSQINTVGDTAKPFSTVAGETYKIGFDYYPLQFETAGACSQISPRLVADREVNSDGTLQPRLGTANAWNHFETTVTASYSQELVRLLIWPGFEGYIDNIMMRNEIGTLVDVIDFQTENTPFSVNADRSCTAMQVVVPDNALCTHNFNETTGLCENCGARNYDRTWVYKMTVPSGDAIQSNEWSSIWDGSFHVSAGNMVSFDYYAETVGTRAPLIYDVATGRELVSLETKKRAHHCDYTLDADAYPGIRAYSGTTLYVWNLTADGGNTFYDGNSKMILPMATAIDGSTCDLVLYDSIVFPSTVLKGDANDDDTVNVLDLVRMKKILAGTVDTPTLDARIDIDGNGNVDAADIAELKAIILKVGIEMESVGFMSSKFDGAADIMREEIVANTADLSADGYSKVYYIAADGNVSNSGISPESPWPIEKLTSIQKAYSFKKVLVLFKRGDTFYGNFVLQSYTSYGAYGIGAKPVILGSEKVTSDWTAAGTTCDGKNLWYYPIVAENCDIGNLILDGGESIARKLHYKNFANPYSAGEYCLVDGSSEKGYTSYEDLDFWYNTDNHRLYMVSETEPSLRFDDIQIAQDRDIIYGNNVKHITVNNLCLKNGGTHGINVCNFSDICISYCEIGNMGGAIGQITQYNSPRYGNGIQLWGSVDGATVESNYVYNCYDAGITHQFSQSTTQQNIAVTDNLVEYCAYNIEYFNNGAYKNILYARNMLRFAGYSRLFDPVVSRNGAAYPLEVDYRYYWGATDSHVALIKGGAGSSASNFVIRGNVLDTSYRALIILEGNKALHGSYEENNYCQGNDSYSSVVVTERDYKSIGFDGTQSDLLSVINTYVDATAVDVSVNTFLQQ